MKRRNKILKLVVLSSLLSGMLLNTALAASNVTSVQILNSDVPALKTVVATVDRELGNKISNSKLYVNESHSTRGVLLNVSDDYAYFNLSVLDKSTSRDKVLTDFLKTLIKSHLSVQGIQMFLSRRK